MKEDAGDYSEKPNIVKNVTAFHKKNRPFPS
jgi:hypothetical protein